MDKQDWIPTALLSWLSTVAHITLPLNSLILQTVQQHALEACSSQRRVRVLSLALSYRLSRLKPYMQALTVIPIDVATISVLYRLDHNSEAPEECISSFPGLNWMNNLVRSGKAHTSRWHWSAPSLKLSSKDQNDCKPCTILLLKINPYKINIDCNAAMRSQIPILRHFRILRSI